MEASVDMQKVERFVGRVLGDMASVFSGVMTSLGHRLGYYRALASEGPLTAAALAHRTGTLERYAREWLDHQNAFGYVEHDGAGTYHLAPEHAAVLAEPSSPVFLLAGLDVAASMWHAEDRLVEAYRSGVGLGWAEHHHRLFCGTEGFYRNAYRAHLTGAWIPALEGVDAKLREGASVADVGCGHGTSTILMAQAYPEARLVGFDLHEDSVRVARERAREAGVSDRVRFEVASASAFPGTYDLVCFMDAFHDLGDPVGAARRARATLASGGTLMLVEPFAQERTADNRGPIATMYYAASAAVCTPNALSQPGGLALGAQAGPLRLREALEAAGFASVRVAATTPFNLVVEARA